MKHKLSVLSQPYVAALKKHLKQGPRASLQPALRLGRRALALGLGTPGLARIHQRALATLGLSPGKNRLARRAEIFLAAAITPMEKIHRAALEANILLDQRTADLTATNQFLKRSILQRKSVEKALRKSGGHSIKLLKESRRQQKHLQHLARQVLSSQEARRKKISHTLQDEIVQILLGVNVRLLTLKREAAGNDMGFKKDIASTQRLVEESVKSINRFARELNIHQPA